MTSDQFNKHIAKTIEKIKALPKPQRERLMQVVDETRKRHEGIAKDIARARDALDDWRLIQKYLVFDAEAKAREDDNSEQ